MPELEDIVRVHGGLIRRIAETYERDPHAVQDLMQDIAIALWQALPRFRGEASLRTFVARVAHNRASTHVARAQRRPPHAPLDPLLPSRARTVEDEVSAASDRARLLQAVRMLPLSTRRLVGLWLEGFTMNEIGEALGITSGNAAVRMKRARDRLRELLSERRERPHAR